MNLDCIKYQLADDELRAPLLEGEISLAPNSMLNIDLEILLGLFRDGNNCALRNRAWHNYRTTLNL